MKLKQYAMRCLWGRHRCDGACLKTQRKLFITAVERYWIVLKLGFIAKLLIPKYFVFSLRVFLEKKSSLCSNEESAHCNFHAKKQRKITEPSSSFAGNGGWKGLSKRIHQSFGAQQRCCWTAGLGPVVMRGAVRKEHSFFVCLLQRANTVPPISPRRIRQIRASINVAVKCAQNCGRAHCGVISSLHTLMSGT